MGGFAMCEHCGSPDLINYMTQQIFEPVYKEAATYKASVYTPELPCRRKEERAWPKIKDRRKR
jgi:hypothetical protein